MFSRFKSILCLHISTVTVCFLTEPFIKQQYNKTTKTKLDLRYKTKMIISPKSYNHIAMLYEDMMLCVVRLDLRCKVFVYTLTTRVISRVTDMERVPLLIGPCTTVILLFSAVSARRSASSTLAWALRYLFIVIWTTSSASSS